MNGKNKDESYRTDVDKFVEILRTAFSKMRVWKNLTLLLSGFLIMLTGFLLLILLEKQLYLSSAVKTAILVFSIVTGISYGIYRYIKSVENSFYEFYTRFTEHTSLYPLKYALDLELRSRNSRLKLHNAAVRKNIESISYEKVSEKLKSYFQNGSELTGLKISSGLALLLTAAVILAGSYNPDALMRSSMFWENFEKPNPYNYMLEPGDITIEQGSTFEPSITFEGSVPEDLSLAVRTNVEEDFRTLPLIPGKEKTFASDPITLNTNAVYYIQMGGFKSPQYRVNVQLRPRFELLTVNVRPPEYTGLDSTEYRYPFSYIRAYQGSQITVAGDINKQLDEISLISISRDDTLKMEKQGGSGYSHSFEIAESDTLLFAMLDESGLSNKNDFEFVIEAKSDEYPFIRMVNPDTDGEIPSSDRLQIEYETGDDFGITNAYLHYELQRAFVEKPVKGRIPLGRPDLNTTEQYNWDLSPLDTKPRDVITYWLEVFDNDSYNGSKRSISQKLTITYPSLAENIEQIEESETDVQETLEDISESFEQVEQEYERFKEQLKENPETTWEQQQTLDGIREQQNRIDKQVEELNKKFEEISKKINESDLMSEETLKTYDELKKLMKEIDDPELLKALEELQRAMESMSQRQLKEALENFEFREDLYRERLNRTLELFKTLKMNSDLDKLAKALDELAEQEKQLSESNKPPAEQIEKQEAIKNDTEKISDQADKLSEQPPQKMEKQVKELQDKASEQLESIKKNLAENIKQLNEELQRDGDNNNERSETGDNNEKESSKTSENENLNKSQPDSTDATRQQEGADSQNQQNQDSDQQNRNQEMTPQQQQRQIQQQFRKLAQEMRNSRQQMNQQQIQINIAALQNILYSLINLSLEQEDLTQETEILSLRSQAFVDKARTEKTISRQFTQIADSLYRVSAEIPQFSNHINEKKKTIENQLDEAVEQLSERNKSKSTIAQRQSLGGINELASMIADLMNQLQNQMNGGMGGGQMTMQQFMKQLQNMSGQQQQLNQQIQNLINDIQGDRLSNDQIDRLNQLARQQNEIRKQIRELQRNGGLESGDRILSELERLSQEMEETINDLRGGQADRQMIERQQNILSRMLSAEKAMQERDKKDEREGTTADERPNAVPPEVTLEELQKKIRSLLKDPNQTKFTEDYQRLIEQYFELLKKLQDKEPS